MSNLQVDVPLQDIGPIGPDGKMVESWFYFLVQLWRRTGGNTPINPKGLTIADVLSVEETFAHSSPQGNNFYSQEITQSSAAQKNNTFQDVLVHPAIQTKIAELLFSAPSVQSKIAELIFAAPAFQSRILDMIFPSPSRDVADETFSSGTDFTAGTSTTITLKESFATSSRLWVFFDGVFQGDDQYSLSGVTITFTSAIPSGTNKVYVKGLR